MRLCLRTTDGWVAEQTVRAVHGSWTNSDRLVQVHGRARLSVVWRRLFQALSLLVLAVSTILLLFDVDLFDVTCSFAVTLCSARRASGLVDARQWEVCLLRELLRPVGALRQAGRLSW